MDKPTGSMKIPDIRELAATAERFGLPGLDVHALASAAVEAKSRAYCPYSKFRVGAALLTKTSLPTTSTIRSVAAEQISSSSLSGRNDPEEPVQHSHSANASQIIIGANIENCSYPVGTCAERSAFATAISLGHLPVASATSSVQEGSSESNTKKGTVGLKGQGLLAVAVSADTDEPCSPCGMCRQFMREFLHPETPIFMFAREGNWTVKTMGELLPMSFGASDLEGGQGKG